MNLGKTLFAQLMEFVPWTSFARIVERHGGDSGVRSLNCTEQFRAMAFAQITVVGQFINNKVGHVNLTFRVASTWRLSA